MTLTYCIYFIIVLWSISRCLAIDIARYTDGDIIANKTCTREICGHYGGMCIDRFHCQCSEDKSTFSQYHQRCISNYNLTTTLNKKKGSSFRLVENGYKEENRGGTPCTFDELSLRAVDLSVNGSQLIDVCGIYTWGIWSCAVESSTYYNGGYWKDIWTAGSSQTTFKVVKRLGVGLYLQWNATLPQRYHGNVISLDLRCKRKFNRSDVISYILFKVKWPGKEHHNTTIGVSTSATPQVEHTTGTPTIIIAKNKNVPHAPEARDSTMIILVVVFCGLFALMLIAILVFCFKKRKVVLFKFWKKKKEKQQQRVDMTTCPMYDMNEYQAVHEHEAPVYTAPSRPGYQDLMIKPPTYQPLVAKTSTSSPPNSPFYYTLEEPGNQSNDVTTHIYHVVEGPS